MPLERDLEDVIAKYPELLEEGLRLLGRQVTIYGRRMDLLFEDRFGRQLIVELKWGAIRDEHVGQLMAYEGLLLTADNPNIRVMLVGTRVPPNFRRSLEFHGVGWKEITEARIAAFLSERGDIDLLPIFKGDGCQTPAAAQQQPSTRRTNPPGTGAAALFAPVQNKWLEAAFQFFASGREELYFVTDANIGAVADSGVRHVYFKASGQNEVTAMADFIDLRTENPADKRLPGSESATGRYYYGFRNLTTVPVPIDVATLRYLSTGNALRHDVPGACLIVEPDISEAGPS